MFGSLTCKSLSCIVAKSTYFNRLFGLLWLFPFYWKDAEEKAEKWKEDTSFLKWKLATWELIMRVNKLVSCRSPYFGLYSKIQHLYLFKFRLILFAVFSYDLATLSLYILDHNCGERQTSVKMCEWVKTCSSFPVIFFLSAVNSAVECSCRSRKLCVQNRIKH